MRRITHIGPTPLAGENSGVTSLDYQYQQQQAHTWAQQSSPTLPPVAYTRPADWLTLPSVGPSNEVFYGLFAVYDHDSNFVIISANNNYTVDWGDGSPINTYSSGSTQTHIYDFAAFDNSTLTSDGFKQVIITIRPAPGQHLFGLEVGIGDSNLSSQYTTQWIDISVAGRFLTDITWSFRGAGFQLPSAMLTEVTVEKNNQSSWQRMFNDAEWLRNIRYLDMSQATGDATGMFSNCYSIQTIPPLSTSNITNMQSMFAGCGRLQNLPAMDTSNNTRFDFFAAGTSISDLGNIVTRIGTSFYYAFVGNPYLTDLSGLDTSSATEVRGMFYACSFLRSVPRLDLRQVTTGLNQMFADTTNLEIVYPLLSNSITAGDNYSMFIQSGLERLTLRDWSYISDAESLFRAVYQLSTAEPMSFPNCTSAHQMFDGSGGAATVEIDLPVATNTNQIFGYARFPRVKLNVPNTTNLTYAFVQNYTITDLEITTGPALTQCTHIFERANLRYPPALNLTNVTDCTGMYSYSAVVIPPADQDMSNVVNLTSWIDHTPVYSIPDYNWSNVTDFSYAFDAYGPTLTDLRAYGMKYSMDLSGQNLIGQISAEYILNNLGTAHNASQTITLTAKANRNQGAINLAATTTAGSTVVTMGNTTGLVTGMFITGTNISDPIAVTFTDAGDTVNLNSHGLSNDTAVGFTSITSTTGISTYTVYYVVNATANTFQLSLTKGGAAINLVNDGSGSLYYPSYISTIVPNTSITLSAPASASGATTIAATYLNTALARIKGWTVSF